MKGCFTVRNIRISVAAAAMALVIAAAAFASSPNSPGPHQNGETFITDQAAGDLRTADTYIGSGSMAVEACTVWKWSGAGTPYARWIAATAGTPVVFSCSIDGPSGYDSVWTGLLGPGYISQVTVATDANGHAQASFSGVSDHDDRDIIYSAASPSQINSQDTVYGSGGGVRYTLHHTRFAPTLAHCNVVTPYEGQHVARLGGNFTWDGQLIGFQPSATQKYRLLCELYTQAGGRIWESDPEAGYDATDTDTDQFTAMGQHLQDVHPHADHLPPDLRPWDSYIFQRVSLQRSSLGGPWTTLQDPATGGYFEAGRRFYVNP